MNDGFVRAFQRLLCALPFALVISSAAATQFSDDEFVFGNWFGLRDTLFEHGLDVQLHYNTQPMWNVSGGEQKGGHYLHNIGLDFLVDFGKIGGPKNTSFLLRLSQRDGNSVSKEEVAPSEGGHTFTVQEIHGEQTFKVVNAQFNIRLLDDRLDITAGRIVGNDDFHKTQWNCHFVNNSFCGSPKTAFLQNPGSFTAYPTAAWGTRARFDFENRHWTTMWAIYDGDPDLRDGRPSKNGSNNNGTDWEFGDNGVLIAGELWFHRNRDSDSKLPGVFKVGGFWMTGNYQDLGRTDDSTLDDSRMVWGIVDHMLYRERSGSDEGLGSFATFFYSLDDKVNEMDYYVSAGLVYTGLFPGRNNDKTGLAFSRGWFTDALKSARRAEGKPNKHQEAVIELNHKFEMGNGVTFTPDIQYVIDPAGTAEISDAFLIGARTTIQF